MFCLHFSRLEERPAESTEEIFAALDPYGNAAARQHWQSDVLAAYQIQHQHIPSARQAAFPCRCPASGAMCFAWARLDNRPELTGKLGLPATSRSELSDARLILHAWERWRQGCLEHLIGDFAFAIFEPEANRLFCARDHLGVRPLYYQLDRQRALVATSLPPLLRLSGKAAAPDQEWLARYLSGTSMDYSKTAWRGIDKLPPGQLLTISPTASECRSYFDLANLQITPRPANEKPDEQLEAYRQQLVEAVTCRLDSDHPVGSELSGGLDSASISALAARELQARGTSLDVFSFAGFEREPEFAEAVCRRWNLQRRHRVSRFAPEHLDAELIRAPRILGSPAEHPSATFHESIYRKAEQAGVRTLLSGFGGDEFVTNPAGLGLVARELLRQHRYAELWRRLPGGPWQRLRKLLQLQRQQRNRLPSALERRVRQQFQQRWDQQLVRPEIARHYQLEERFFAPVRFDSDFASLRNYILGARWQPGVPTRLENCSLLALSHRIEYRWPLLDIRLIKLFLSLPAGLTYERGLDRHLHRRAVEDVVPEIILRQPGKDMGPLRAIPDHINSMCQYRHEIRLHPLLLELIDVATYRTQCRELDRGFRAVGMENWLSLWQNVHAVSQANSWLEHWVS
jgi:asparagine synthase (glutamine-hydrolysing)